MRNPVKMKMITFNLKNVSDGRFSVFKAARFLAMPLWVMLGENTNLIEQ